MSDDSQTPAPEPHANTQETETSLPLTSEEIISSLENEINSVKSENDNLKNTILTMRAAIGIKGGDSLEEQHRKIRVINYLRLGCLHLHGADKEWQQRQRVEVIPFLIENLTIEDMEGFSDAVSDVAAHVVANLKSPNVLSIKARREQKDKEAWANARKAQAENANKSPKAKAEARKVTSENKAEEKALNALMKSGLSEDMARKMLASRFSS
jgi:hypothetical protein